jgi:hypothetical protein
VQTNDIVLIREFNHRFRKICDESGYVFVYDFMALIREFIPCHDVNIDIVETASENPNDLWPTSLPLGVATPKFAFTLEMFYRLLPSLSLAKCIARDIFRQLIAGEPVKAVSFGDYPECMNGANRYFYEKLLNCGDTATTAGLLGRYQVLESPLTKRYYLTYISMGRDSGHSFNGREKELLSLFFDLFVQELRKKLYPSDKSLFLPYFINAKFSPRELATIKTCFDLAQSRAEITRAAVATRLHLRDTPNPERGILKKAIDKVDYDVGKIRKTVLADFEKDAPENYGKLYRELGLEHFPELFRAYAYFGFYPPGTGGPGQFISYLSGRLEKFR